jgi:hypothetical protein
MENKKIAKIKVILGRIFSFEASGLPESSLYVVLGFFLIVICVGVFIAKY